MTMQIYRFFSRFQRTRKAIKKRVDIVGAYPLTIAFMIYEKNF